MLDNFVCVCEREREIEREIEIETDYVPSFFLGDAGTDCLHHLCNCSPVHLRATSNKQNPVLSIETFCLHVRCPRLPNLASQYTVPETYRRTALSIDDAYGLTFRSSIHYLSPLS